MKITNLLYSIVFLPLILGSCRKHEMEEIKPDLIHTASENKQIISKASVRLEKADSLYLIKSSTVKAAAQFDASLLPFRSLSKYDVALYRIRYKTSYQGKEITASGIMAVPAGTALWSTLSYHHGTVFANNDCPTNNTGDQFIIAALSSAGYIITAPDYVGFGSSSGITHPYYVAKYAASASRDLLLAAQEFLKEKNVQKNSKLFLAGYSQGGNVTMAVAKSLEENPLPGYELTASAAGAGGYDMEGIFTHITSQKIYPSPNYVAYIIQAYRTSYGWSTPLDYYFKSPYASIVPSLIDGKTDGAVINKNLTNNLDSLLQPEFILSVKNGKDRAFANALKENSLHNWKPGRLLRIYHSDGDEVVPFSDSEAAYKKMLGNGSGFVSFVQIHGKSHGAASVPMISGVIEWFNSLNLN